MAADAQCAHRKCAGAQFLCANVPCQSAIQTALGGYQSIDDLVKENGRLRIQHKLDNVCYDIRGPIAAQARKMEDEGHRILKLNIGNPAPFGFEAPDDIVKDVIHNLPTSQGYSDST